MYANMRARVSVDGRSAEYGVSEIRISAGEIELDLDGGEKEEPIGKLTLNLAEDIDVALVITADY